MKFKFYIWVAALVVAGCKDPQVQKVQLAELDGTPIDLSDFKGKVVFINFWATWCAPCIKEMPTIELAKNSLKDKEVVFLFASNEDADEIEEFRKERPYDFHYVRLLNMEALKITALPTTQIYDGDGTLTFSEAGYRDWNDPANLKLILEGTSNEPVSFKLESIASPSGTGSAEPYLYSDDSVVYLSWVEKSESGAAFKMSRLAGKKWTDPTLIAEGKTWFVNWADYPMLAADGENMVAHFLDRSGDEKYAYDVKLTVSNDGGTKWHTPQLLNDDKKQAEHGFVTLLPYRDNFFVTWLDGRNTAMEGMEGAGHEGHHGSMSLRAAIIDRSGNKIKEWELDNKTCDCCQTSAAITTTGPVVVYRDRSDEEIRDMSIVRLVNDKWTTPQPIHNDNWKIAGCPVNGPRVVSMGNNLAVAWFSAAGDAARVNVIFSKNGGESFEPVIRIDEGNAIGRVDIDLLDSQNALVTWMEGGQIKIAKVNANGVKDPSMILAESSDARSSGFPQLTITRGRAVLAWTDDKEKKVKTASISL